MKLIGSVICLFLIFGLTMGAKKKIHPSVTICKRFDPDLSKCFRENFEKLLPLLKNGIPEMNITPIEPVHVEYVRMDFPATRSVSLGADLTNMKVWGSSDLKIKESTSSISSTKTLDTYMHYTIPKLSMESDSKAIGKFLLLAIDAHGNFTSAFEGLEIKMHWTSESFMKKGKEHYKWTNTIDELTIKKFTMHFDNLFGSNYLSKEINNIKVAEYVNPTLFN